MRTIEISTSVFSRIWALRQEGEETEDEILDRVLNSRRPRSTKFSVSVLEDSFLETGESRTVLWRDDIVSALQNLGGEADLAEIYRTVVQIRKQAGRSLPRSTEAVIRRELENNSSDSESYTHHRNLFRSVNGIGAGRWALR